MKKTLDQKVIRDCLQQSISLDPYLTEVAKRFASHRFLGRAQQGLYLRAINLLDALTKKAQRSSVDLNVLDWGTGKGHISYLLSQHGYKVCSCDFKGGGGQLFLPGNSHNTREEYKRSSAKA